MNLFMKKLHITPGMLYIAQIVVLSVALAVVYLIHITDLYQLYVLHDEFGYWANAAYFAGFDWSGVASLSPYYSYGYSVLLIPLLLIFKDSVLMYRAAIVLNCIFYIAAFIVSRACARLMFPKLNRYVSVLLCFLLALYCNNLLQVNIAWGEALLYFMYWLSFYTLIIYSRKRNLPALIAFIAECFFMYMIHQRTLGVIIAGLITIVVMFLQDKHISIKKIIVPVSVVAGVLLVAFLIKELVINNVWKWTDSGLAGQNDYSGQWNKVVSLFTSKNGIPNLVMHVCGKILYLMVASCSLIFWGLRLCIRRLLPKKRNIFFPVHLFLILSLLGTVGIVSIYMSTGMRIDCVVYGRYMEFMVGPLMMIGLHSLARRRPAPFWYGIYTAILLLMAAGSVKLFHSTSTFTRIMSCGTSLFYNTKVDAFSLKYCVIVSAAIGLILFLAAYFKKIYLWFVSAVVIIVFWFLNAGCALDNEVLAGQEYIKDTSVIAELIEHVEAPIYFTCNNNVEAFYNRRIENLQFLIKDMPIKAVEYGELDALSGDYYLVQYHTDNINLERYTVVSQAYGLVVLAPAGSELEKACISYSSEHPYEFASTMMHSATGSADSPFSADHAEGFLVFAQDLTLSPGTYHVDITLKVSDVLYTDSNTSLTIPASELVLCASDVSYNYGAELLCTQNFTADLVDEAGYLHISYDFTCENTVSGAEIRVYSYGKALLELEGICYNMEP